MPAPHTSIVVVAVFVLCCVVATYHYMYLFIHTYVLYSIFLHSIG